MFVAPPIIVMPPPAPKCPSCGNLEKQKTVCAHCGYEYEDEPMGFWDVVGVGVVIAVFVVGFLFLITTIFNWIDGTPLVYAISKTAKAFWGVLSNIW